MNKKFIYVSLLFGVFTLVTGCGREMATAADSQASGAEADRTGSDEKSVAAHSLHEAGKRNGKENGKAGHGGDRPQSVQVAAVQQQDVPLEVDALGTVIAHNTALVKARVDGPLLQVNFQEGQTVKAGALLAQIDPGPYQIALDQALGQLQQDEAKLSNAHLDAARYRDLLAKNSIARQDVDTQEALVRQYEGVVTSSRAQVANARLQLGYTRIVAPISGRLGLRQLDIGNLVKASDSTGLVSITQTQPINVVFSVPASEITRIEQAARNQGKPRLRVDAWSREAGRQLASGRLLTLDNQIDAQTATVKLKAEFANKDNQLFPNQFVLARLAVGVQKHALTLPVSAIQQGTQGSYVYVVEKSAEPRVALRPVKTGVTYQERIVIESGVEVGEEVVIDGVDKLRAGSRIDIPAAKSAGIESGTRSATDTGQGSQQGARQKQRKQEGPPSAPQKPADAAAH